MPRGNSDMELHEPTRPGFLGGYGGLRWWGWISPDRRAFPEGRSDAPLRPREASGPPSAVSFDPLWNQDGLLFTTLARAPATASTQPRVDPPGRRRWITSWPPPKDQMYFFSNPDSG